MIQGGVTTSTVTVPLITALGMAVAIGVGVIHQSEELGEVVEEKI